MSNTTTPQEKHKDETLALLHEGYNYIKNRMDKHQSDIVQTHLLGEDVICISGKEAAEIFYDTKRFARSGAAPKRVQKTLTGENTVQGMDGSAHDHRKSLFISLTKEHYVKVLAEICAKEWETVIPRWEKAEKINLFDESKIVLCKVACQWGGVPLPETEAKDRAGDFAAMVDAFGAVGPRHWKGKAARIRTEHWIGDVIDNVRTGRLKASKSSPLYIMANHKGLDGKLLDSSMAAKELINLLRPIVAVSTYITFMALALHEHPEYKNILQRDAGALHSFVQEVRRFYPFTPFVGARVKTEFVWGGCEFKTGTLVMLDVYGINHDSRIWDNPNEFRPERFRNWEYDPFEFIPHGGGDPAKGHRCPGEGITVEVMKATLDFLVHKIHYKVPEQDLDYDMSKIPTYPKSGFVITNVKP